MNEPAETNNNKTIKAKILRLAKRFFALASLGSGLSTAVLSILSAFGISVGITFLSPLIIALPIVCGLCYLIYKLIPDNVFEKITNMLQSDKLSDVELVEIKKMVDCRTSEGQTMREIETATVYEKPKQFFPSTKI